MLISERRRHVKHCGQLKTGTSEILCAALDRRALTLILVVPRVPQVPVVPEVRQKVPVVPAARRYLTLASDL
jgi:hypothetical protein